MFTLDLYRESSLIPGWEVAYALHRRPRLRCPTLPGFCHSLPCPKPVPQPSINSLCGAFVNPFLLGEGIGAGEVEGFIYFDFLIHAASVFNWRVTQRAQGELSALRARFFQGWAEDMCVGPARTRPQKNEWRGWGSGGWFSGKAAPCLPGAVS